ncbi:MAG: DUF2288 domain-containing protein, partial [Minicystis sp.]
EVFWTDLQAHAGRDALIVVAPDLDLLEAGEALASNETSRVEAWIHTGQLAKPTAEELRAWPNDPAARFESLIVAPFVLIRPLTRVRSPSN